MFVVPAFFWACAYFNDFHYSTEDEEYTMYEKGLLASPLQPNVEFQQKKICTENHIVDPARVALVAISAIAASEELTRTTGNQNFRAH